MNQDVALASIVTRFGCDELSKSWQMCQNSVSNYLIRWQKNGLDEIQEIFFQCETFNGCTYSVAEIFQNLNDRFQLTGQVKEDNNKICDQGVAGEKICVSKGSKTITLLKLKFRQKPMSFD